MKKTGYFFLAVSLTMALSYAAASKPTPLSGMEVFSKRVQVLMEKMEKGIAVFRAENPLDKNFYYLTGFPEPHAILLLVPQEEQKTIFFVRPENPISTIWDGKNYDLKDAKQIFGMDSVYRIDQFEEIFSQYLKDNERVYCLFNDKELVEKIRETAVHSNMHKEIIDIAHQIHAMRLIKDKEEIRLIKKAVDITGEALIEAIKAAEPGMHEYEIQAIIEYVFRKNGASGSGFPSIVGSGPNTTILHYKTNSRKFQEDDLLLMDVGAECGHYMADISRTIPVNGRLTPEQREIYEIVLNAQKKAIEKVAPGVGLFEIHKLAVEIIKEGLYELGLITDKKSAWQYRVWLMYNTNHWLGLDVHDVGGRGPDDGIGKKLEPGMIFTVEPGIYIGEHSLLHLPKKLGKHTPKDETEIAVFVDKVEPLVKKYMNIGIRIEDNILVTEAGYENLSQKIPKEIKDIEKLMKKKSAL